MNKTAQIIYSVELSEFDLRQTNELLAYKIIRIKDDLSSVLDDLPEGVSLGPSVKALNNIHELLKKLAQSYDILITKKLAKRKNLERLRMGSSIKDKDLLRFESTKTGSTYLKSN